MRIDLRLQRHQFKRLDVECPLRGFQLFVTLLQKRFDKIVRQNLVFILIPGGRKFRQFAALCSRIEQAHDAGHLPVAAGGEPPR